MNSAQKLRVLNKFNNIPIQDANESCGYREDFEITGVPRDVVRLIFQKAIEINNKKLLSEFPATLDTYLTSSYSNPKICHSVKVKQTGSISCECDSKCLRFAAYKICSHSLALAIKLDVVDKFFDYLLKKKQKYINNNIGNCRLPDWSGN